MAEFHFVEDYERLVDDLLVQYPIDEAMAKAVGGAYDQIGQIEVDLLKHAGLRSGMFMLDMGCGSGRLAYALSKTELQLQYTGVDIIQKMLDYAAGKSPKHFHFVCHRNLSIPASTSTLELVCAFSLFTHLLHHETYLYMMDIHRVLKSGGKLVFSFLEFATEDHWPIFISTVEGARTKTSPHLNSFIERNTISIWASRLGFMVEDYIGSAQSVGTSGSLGQTTAVLRRI